MDSQFFLQDLPPKIFINDEEFIDHDDIVRGDRDSTYSTLQTSAQASAASLKSFSTASSGSFRLAGGRLGTLATRLERAITRWARKNRADSSSSMTSGDTSETSRSSFRTANKSKKSSRCKRRLPSVAEIQQREQSLRAVSARIRAREIGRIVPREFNLYSPPSSPLQDADPIGEEQEQQPIRTFSLDLMLPHLEHIRRKLGKSHRPRHRSRSSLHELDHSSHPHHLDPLQGHSTKFQLRNITRTDAIEDSSPKMEKGKGKDRMSPIMPPLNPPQTASTSRRDPVEGKPRQAWWLDVASPTWEDMRALGKLLHLHPLTLEDILQKEPREKLELFPRLGYSFIVFRAIESSSQNERLDVVSQKTSTSQLPFQSVAKEICIYLVVFRDGICTFHFSNISEHLDRVRGKLQTSAQATHKSSTWIAHGILDSVVDSFFPHVEEIGEHVAAIESLVSDKDNPTSTITAVDSRSRQARPAAEKAAKKAAPSVSVDEKHEFEVASVKTTKTQSSVPRLTCGLMWWRLRRALSQLISYCMRSKPRKPKPSVTHTAVGLRRMARTRRLATSLARALATKPEVIAGIRKRLLASHGPVSSDDAEVAIYFGDVQDHILTLQQSLGHYERLLSNSHPMYLQKLHIDLLRARFKLDYGAFILTIVAVVTLPPAVIIDASSMNVMLPHNTDGYRIFTVVVVLTLCIQVAVLFLVRYWWVKASRRPWLTWA